VVSLAGHDSHTGATDVYPPVSLVRLDKCVEMLAGIVSASDGWKLAFPGRAKGSGPWQLSEVKKGFPGAHGSRHLYNMMGGKVFEVDLFVLRRLPEALRDGHHKIQVRTVACTTELADVYILERENKVLARALDCLPWTSLSWSMHRGMKDLLLAYGKPVMNHYRTIFVDVLKGSVPALESILMMKGWDKSFIETSMADMASSSILSGEGNSGDLVRIVVSIVDALFVTSDSTVSITNKDETRFWRQVMLDQNEGALSATELSLDNVVALTKFFVLEWSQELDYQLYHELPVDLYLT
jgi:hypothetical protein